MNKETMEEEMKSPLELLNEFKDTNDDNDREVIFTFGSEELVKESGRYYLSNTKCPSIFKEISKTAANELYQSYNFKTRDDLSMEFDDTIKRFDLFI